MFICFEGIAGAGKTTQAHLLRDYLRDVKGRDVSISSVYDGSFRKVVSDFMNASLIKSDANATMFLFQALHATQRRNVERALSSGEIAIADSWRSSFYAYHLCQNTFDGDKRLMRELDKLGHGTLEPDICFLADLPAEIAHSRYLKRERSINDNGLKIMDLEFFFSVAKYYREIAQEKKWNIVDFSRDHLMVFGDIKATIDKIL